MIRTRFAPSPTGFLHIGGLRTALFAYLFAKKNQGSFLLRIEDTDQTREVKGTKAAIITDLQAVGISPDESYTVGGDFGPYIQSERLAIYQEKVKELLKKKHAYHCFCSSERLEKIRTLQKKQKLAPRYDGSCRKLSEQKIAENLEKNMPYTIRMKIQRTKSQYILKDVVHGEVAFSASQIDDQIILKTDGFPTYHLACVVDDYLMKITHVIRGEEWLSSTPKHLQLYEYFGWQAPVFVHLPLLLSTDRAKLSKRHGDVAVREYLKKGFLPDSLLNFIALLGWNSGDAKEIFSLQELVQEFSLEKLGKSGAIFDVQKLRWMNQQYIKKLNEIEYLEKLQPFLNKEYQNTETQTLKKMLLVLRNNLSQLDEINQELEVFVPKKLSLKNKKLLQTATNQKLLANFLEQIKKSENWQKTDFLAAIKIVQKQTGIKGKDLWMPIRLALTTKEQGPELPAIAEILGKKGCIIQIEKILLF